MACATCSSEPVLLASSTAVLTAGVGSFYPSVASNIFVGYIAKKAPTPSAWCRSYQHPLLRVRFLRRASSPIPLSHPHYTRRCEASRQHIAPPPRAYGANGKPHRRLRRAPCRRSFQVRRRTLQVLLYGLASPSGIWPGTSLEASPMVSS